MLGLLIVILLNYIKLIITVDKEVNKSIYLCVANVFIKITMTNFQINNDISLKNKCAL